MDRIFNEKQTLENEVVEVFGQFTIGAAGAVSAVKGGGIKSISKLTGDGLYEIEFERCHKFLSFNGKFISTADDGAEIAVIEIAESASTLQSGFRADGKVKIQLRDFDGAKANAASGSVLLFSASLRNSSVNPWD